MGFKKILAVALSAAVALSGFSLSGLTKESVKVAKAASSTFDDLDQSEMTDAMGAGWNLGNQLESALNGTPNETYWGNPTISSGLIKAVKNAGFDSIRVPVSYLSKIGSDSNYTIDSAWLNRVKEVVDMCIENDLYVIINMHGDGYNSIDGGWLLCNGSDQTTIRAKYKACWKQIATLFKDYDEHLIFESMNEEFDGTYSTPNTTYYSNINALNQIFVDTVRQTGGNNDKRWLMLPGWNTDIEYTTGNYGFSIPSDNYKNSNISGKRIMISVHYYNPWDFCGAESSTYTQWGSSATNSSKVPGYGDESQLNSLFYKLYSSFTSQGYPVVIGEYGAIDKSEYDSANTSCRAAFAKAVCTYAKKYGCVPVWWDNGVTGTYGFGLFNRYTYAITGQSIIDAIMSVYPASETSSSATTVTFSANNLSVGAYTTDLTRGDFTIGASSAKNVSVEYATATVDGTSYTKRLKMNGAGNSTGRYIKFTTSGAGSVSFVATSTSSSADRVVRLASGSVGGTTVSDTAVSDSAVTKTVDIPSAGTYYLYSTSCGIYVYGLTVSVNISKGTDISLSSNNLTTGTYTSDIVSGDFTIGASSSKYVSVESCSVSVNGTSYSKRLKMNGGGNSTGRYIKFTTTGACTVSLTAASTTSSATRTFRMSSGSVGGTNIADNTVSGTATKVTYTVPSAGTYYLYSVSSGVYVYNVSVNY